MMEATGPIALPAALPTSDRELQESLERQFPVAIGQQILIGLFHDGRELYAEKGGTAAPGGGAERFLVAGCLAKLLTAAVLRQIAARLSICLDDAVADQVPDRMAHLRRLLAGVTFRHLLEHTHGIDASGVRCLPVGRNRFIDVALLCSQLEAAPRLGVPGAIYSYSNTGAWIAATLVEQWLRRPFWEALGTVLPADYAGDDHWLTLPSSGEYERRCPATGGALRIAAPRWMAFLRRLISPDGGLVDRSDTCHWRSRIRRKEGWSAIDAGVYLGWNYHGCGWFGHNSVLPGAPALVRIHPLRQIAFFIACRGLRPSTLSARLLGHAFPELHRIDTPRRLREEQVHSLDFNNYAGEYAAASHTARVFLEGRQTLRLELWPRDREPDPPASAKLLPAADNLFFTSPAQPSMPRCVQFIVPRERGFNYLWDGESVLRHRASPL